jgi:hypothetical protein
VHHAPTPSHLALWHSQGRAVGKETEYILLISFVWDRPGLCQCRFRVGWYKRPVRALNREIFSGKFRFELSQYRSKPAAHLHRTVQQRVDGGHGVVLVAMLSKCCQNVVKMLSKCCQPCLRDVSAGRRLTALVLVNKAPSVFPFFIDSCDGRGVR